MFQYGVFNVDILEYLQNLLSFSSGTTSQNMSFV